MEWIFGQLYNSLTTGVVRACEASEARRRHDEKSGDYCAVLRDIDADRTIAAVEISTANGGCNVHFLDAAGRLYMRYLFVTAKQSPQLFLNKTRFIEYTNDASKTVARTEVYQISEDGGVRFELFDESNDVHEVKTGTRNSVGELYESMPEFGDWSSLLRTDRDAPLDQQADDSPSWLASKTVVDL